MNDLTAKKTMNVREVAEALGTAESTIRNIASELFPNYVKNGVATLFDECHVTLIKNAIVPRDLTLKSKLESTNTELEMMMLDAKVSEWKTRRIAELSKKVDVLQIENDELKPKAESFNVLMRSEQTMSITDCAKHFGLHPKTEVFPYLRAMKYLTLLDLPTQAAIDAGYLALRHNHDRFGVCHPQAVVLTWMLENWRAHVVHQVKRWCGEIN